MKKLLLSLGLVLVGSTAMSQVIFRVEAPAAISGNYGFTSNGDGSSWGLASLSGVNVTDTIQVANDGTPGTNPDGNPFSAEACTGPSMQSLAGKIALIYRGTCGFGVKALNAQNAGAVAVIIVNRDEELINMNGGTEGASVTIPVIFVPKSTGTAIVNQITGGTPVVAFIGDKTGFFNDDLGFQSVDVMRARASAIPQTIAQNGTEFSVTPGAWVRNYGQNDQTGITLSATISGTPYTNTSTAFDLLSGDSAYVTLPAFAPATWAVGSHTISYTINAPGAEQYPADNTIDNGFDITSNLFALAKITNGLPTSTGGSKSSSSTSEFTTCIVFRDANGSRLATNGIYFAASTATEDSLEGLEVLGSLLKWDDVFTDLNDPNFTITNYSEIASGSFLFEGDYQDSMMFLPFTTPQVLLNNQRYMFCVSDYSNKIFFGYDNQTKYAQVDSVDFQPRYPIKSDDTWYGAGFTGSPVPALAANMFPAEELGIADKAIEASAYPNPTKDVVTVKVNANGDATLKVTDLAGRNVSTQNIKIENGQFSTNVGNMNAGTYVFVIDYANGTSSRFNVVVTK